MRTAFRARGIRENLAALDRWLLIATTALLGFGTILVWAATKNWFAAQGLDPQYYLKRHVINVLIGLLLAYSTTLIDYRMIKAYTPIIYGVGILGLIAVLVPGVGSRVNGAKAWIALPGGFSAQPAELAKIGVICAMALLLSEHGQSEPSDRDILKSLGLAALPLPLIMLEPDLGMALIIGAVVIALIAASGARPRWVAGLLIVVALGGVLGVKAGVVKQYQIKRLQSFVDPAADPQQSGYQLRQSRITIGSGGLLGTGLFKGPQTNGRFVPEQQTDFIFTVAGEETGFLGTSFILLCFAIILSRSFAIAKRTNDPFGRLLAIGIIAWFAFQAFENMGMTMGLVPMTGIPLPFVSYGGSSMFANLVGMGLLQNIHLRSR